VRTKRRDLSGATPSGHIDDYVFGFANINYDTTVVVSIDFNAVIPSKLGEAAATKTMPDAIYTGDGGLGAWMNIAEVEGVGGIKGFRCMENKRGATADFASNPKWKAPRRAQLAFKFYCTEPQTLILTADDWDAEVEITASDRWQEIVIPPGRLLLPGSQKPRPNWEGISKLQLKPKGHAEISIVVFAQFKWVVPEDTAPKGSGSPK